MDKQDIDALLDDLLRTGECEWIEFKENNDDRLGEYLSALSNAATLHGRNEAFLVFGVNDERRIKGTNFKLTNTTKVKILPLLSPQIDFSLYETEIAEKRVVIVIIAAARNYPTKFKDNAYIRIESAKVNIAKFPDYERELWLRLGQHKFEGETAAKCKNLDEVTQLVDGESALRMYGDAVPRNAEEIIEALCSRKLIIRRRHNYLITNLGALMFARDLSRFPHLAHHQIRVIRYRGNNNVAPAVIDYIVRGGYALEFTALIDSICSQLPINEVISGTLRTAIPLYPKTAIREFLANALVHQDFIISGIRPMIEIYENRLEISNPGIPLITIDRFIDHAPKSRNELLVAAMRGVRICEERGSGIDRAISECEAFQLPAPKILSSEDCTKVIMFAPMSLSDMSAEDKIRATYQHCVLKYVSGEYMTNESLRGRLGISRQNYPMASRIIKMATEAGKIKVRNEDSKANRYREYVPYWDN